MGADVSKSDLTNVSTLVRVKEALASWHINRLKSVFTRYKTSGMGPNLTRKEFFDLFGVADVSLVQDGIFLSLPLWMFSLFASVPDDQEDALGTARALDVFLVVCMFCEGPLLERVQLCFELFDDDGSLTIDEQEMLGFLNTCCRALFTVGAIAKIPGQRVLEKVTRKMFREVDDNGDGDLSPNEFFEWAREHSAMSTIMDRLDQAAIAMEEEENSSGAGSPRFTVVQAQHTDEWNISFINPRAAELLRKRKARAAQAKQTLDAMAGLRQYRSKLATTIHQNAADKEAAKYHKQPDTDDEVDAEQQETSPNGSFRVRRTQSMRASSKTDGADAALSHGFAAAMRLLVQQQRDESTSKADWQIEQLIGHSRHRKSRPVLNVIDTPRVRTRSWRRTDGTGPPAILMSPVTTSRPQTADAALGGLPTTPIHRGTRPMSGSFRQRPPPTRVPSPPSPTPPPATSPQRALRKTVTTPTSLYSPATGQPGFAPIAGMPVTSSWQFAFPGAPARPVK